MAIQPMGYVRTEIGAEPEILYNSEYVGVAVTLDSAAFTDGVCKAGTPVSTDGTKNTDGSSILGILLHDVYVERPQGTAVIGGYIKTAVAEAHSGVTITAAMQTALKNVVFM